MLRIWFFVVTCIVSVYALLVHPSASPVFTPSAQRSDSIQSAVLSSSRILAAPLPLRADRDIVQPPDYVPHDIPGEEPSAVEFLPEAAPELELLPDDLPVDFPDEWYIPPEAYNSYVITPENTPPPLGYSGMSEQSTELEHLAAINTNLGLIVYLITAVIAAGIVCLICRAVWPLFRG